MNYEVTHHRNRDEFQAFLDALPPHKTLHSFEWDAPNIVAVYQWASQPPAGMAIHTKDNQ